MFDGQLFRNVHCAGGEQEPGACQDAQPHSGHRHSPHGCLLWSAARSEGRSVGAGCDSAFPQGQRPQAQARRRNQQEQQRQQRQQLWSSVSVSVSGSSSRRSRRASSRGGHRGAGSRSNSGIEWARTIDVDTAVIASNACVGGASTAASMVASLRGSDPDLPWLGSLAGVVGYVIGTPLGLALARSLGVGPV